MYIGEVACVTAKINGNSAEKRRGISPQERKYKAQGTEMQPRDERAALLEASIFVMTPGTKGLSAILVQYVPNFAEDVRKLEFGGGDVTGNSSCVIIICYRV